MMKRSERLKQLLERLETQDNRATAHPIFLVQQEYRVYGIDPQYCRTRYNSIWVYKDDPEYTYETEDEARKAFSDDEYMHEESFEDKYEEIFYHTGYQYVCAHFTEAAAQNYIDQNKHNLANPRIYVDSQHRCYEWIETLEAIKSIARKMSE